MPWAKSEAKKVLRELLEDETSWVHVNFNQANQAACIEIIRNKDPLFQQYAKTNFYTNFRNLKAGIDAEKLAVQFDRMAFEKEQQRWPINETLANGEKRWQGSEAQKLLRTDFKHLSKKKWKPSQFYNSRLEYRSWSLDSFRNLYYEEMRYEKGHHVYWQAARNMDMRKKRVTEEESGNLIEENVGGIDLD